MASPFSFEPMLVFGWLASMLLIGALLRARIPFFQRFLFPGCHRFCFWQRRNKYLQAVGQDGRARLAH